MTYGAVNIYRDCVGAVGKASPAVEGEGSSFVRGVCLPDAVGVPFEFFGVPTADGGSTYSNFLESRVKVTGPCDGARQVSDLSTPSDKTPTADEQSRPHDDPCPLPEAIAAGQRH